MSMNCAIPALAELQSIPHWVCWRYVNRSGQKKPTKPPHSPHTGRTASATDPKNWADFKTAAAAARRFKMEGVGFALSDGDQYSGIDLDRVYDPETGFEPWAAEILDLAETYAEISPSGCGVRMIARGKVKAALKFDPASVEIYGRDRYLTITGNHIAGTPKEIREAPKTIALLQARVEEFRVREAAAMAEKMAGAANNSDDRPLSERARAKASRPALDADEEALEGDYVARALKHIPSDDRSIWLSVGGALHDSDIANSRALWDEWSRTSPKFNAKDQTATWKSFGRSYGGPRAAIGSIIAEARRNGFNGRKHKKLDHDEDAARLGQFIVDELLAGEDEANREEESGGGETGSDGRRAQGDRSKAFRWSKPAELPTGRIPVPPFEPEFLPASVRDWAVDVSERLQCPLDFVGVSTIVAMGSLIGRKLSIRPQRETSWSEVPNLWGCIVGDPGVLKSPAMMEALSPIRKLETEAGERNKAAQERFRRAEELYAMKVKAANRVAAKLNPDAITEDHLPGEAPEPPRLERYMYGDTTYEALAVGLIHNPNGVLAFRDELVSLLKRLEDDTYAAERGFYLTGWNGDGTYPLDRKMSGHHVIEGMCLSLLGSTQPGRIADFVRASQGAGDDGLLQRFGLIVWPDIDAEWADIDRAPNWAARHSVFDVFSRLATFDHKDVGAEIDPYGGLPFLRFDSEAAREFLAWRGPFESRVRGEELSPSIRSYLAKHRKLVPALALIFHIADGQWGPVSVEPLLRALAISQYAEQHAIRCYGAGVLSHVQAARAILHRIQRKDLVDGFTARDVHQAGWSHLTNRPTVGEALDMLVDHGWLNLRQEITGGRPAARYYINPQAKP